MRMLRGHCRILEDQPYSRCRLELSGGIIRSSTEDKRQCMKPFLLNTANDGMMGHSHSRGPATSQAASNRMAT